MVVMASRQTFRPADFVALDPYWRPMTANFLGDDQDIVEK